MGRAGGGDIRTGQRLVSPARRADAGRISATGFWPIGRSDRPPPHCDLRGAAVCTAVRRRPARSQERAAHHRPGGRHPVCRHAARGGERRLRRVVGLAVYRRARLQRDPAGRQQVGLGVVPRRSPRPRHGHSSGRTAARRRHCGGNPARHGGGLELARRLRGRRRRCARRRPHLRAALPAAARGGRRRSQARA